jgi:hypothetical protein
VALAKQFDFDDNDPTTFKRSYELEQVTKAYLDNPLVKLKRKTFERLGLLHHLGEYIYGMEGNHEAALKPFE